MDKQMNKKGASFLGYTEAILLSVLFLFAFGAVIVGMNAKYGEHYDSSAGIATGAIQDSFNTYQSTLQSTTDTGQASFNTVNGLSLSSSWQLVKATGNLVWGVLGGGWTENIALMIGLPSYFAFIFRILYFISIGFIIITILLKVRP